MVGRDPHSARTDGEPGASQPALRACSACAGDYEDPDRTVWTPDEEEEDLALELTREKTHENAECEASVEGMNEDDASDDEFPAQEQ